MSRPILRRVLRGAAWPARRFIDPRFGHLEAKLDRLEENLDRLHQAIRLEAETAAEFFTLHSRTLDQLSRRIDTLNAESGALAYVGAPLAAAGEGLARLLNYAESHVGFDAQASLWFNPPVSLAHHPGSVTVGAVNERIIEAPFAIARLGRLPLGASILDFGAVESTLSLSLAALGYRVTAIDLRPYPLDHPNLTAVAELVEDWEGPAEPFDAVVSISSLEHVGRAGYGGPAAAPNHDRVVLERMAAWLKPRGLLILTAPFGKAAIDDFQRTYDEGTLEELMDGWKVQERFYGICADGLHWTISAGPPPAETWAAEATRGVVMLSATRA